MILFVGREVIGRTMQHNVSLFPYQKLMAYFHTSDAETMLDVLFQPAPAADPLSEINPAVSWELIVNQMANQLLLNSICVPPIPS